jgi:Asp-tRNA(Asn)/Glu-tRNA(Gln) amidotransferase C subunit
MATLQEQAQKDAEKILASFGKTLAKVKVPKVKAENVRENKGMRKENVGQKADASFRAGMFRNAPKHDDEYLLVAKKEW